MKHVILGLVGLLLSGAAGAAEGQWNEAFGQGNFEYSIVKQGYRLDIGCPTKDGSADVHSGVSLLKDSDNSAVESFTVEVGGAFYQGPFDADSKAGNDKFISFLAHIRKGNAVVKFSGRSLVFPKSNAAQTVPVYRKKGFVCNMG